MEGERYKHESYWELKYIKIYKNIYYIKKRGERDTHWLAHVIAVKIRLVGKISWEEK
jgi:hypothetical protein